MKTLIKKSATVVLSAILLLMIVFCAVTLLGNTKSVSAEENIEMPTNATMAAEDAGFTMVDAASVRIESEGIKFETEITKTYYDTLVGDGNTVEFIAHAMNKDDASKYVLRTFPNIPDFSKGNTYTYRTYLNFDNIATGEEENAYKTNFSVDVYAKVTDALGGVTYYQAYRADEVVRTMRAVANSAYLNWKESDEFNKDQVTEYFTVGSRNETVDSYTTNEGNVIFTMPDGYADPADGATVKAYLNAKPITATYDKTTDRYIVSNVAGVQGDSNLGKEDYISVFGADNKVYSTKAVKATEITEENITSTLAAATSGYYVLTGDVDMAGKTMEYDTTKTTDASGAVRFAGTFDGNGYEISNFTPQSGHFGLFQWTGAGFSIKNLNFHALTNTSNGVLIGQVKSSGTIENLIMDVDTLSCATSAGCITAVFQGALSVKDSFFNVDSATGASALVGFVAGGEAPAGNLTIDNVVAFVPNENLVTPFRATHSSGAEYYTFGIDGELATAEEDYYSYDDALDCDTKKLEDVKLKAVAEVYKQAKYDSATKIDASNISVLQTATNGYFILTEDIEDFSTAFTGTWTPNATFAGTLNGNGKTIKNFNGKNLFNGFAGTVKNISFIDANLSSGKGFLSNGTNVGSNVAIKNSLFKFKTVSGTRAALLGYQTGGVAKLKDVYIEMPYTATNNYYGYITCHAITGLVLDNVYCVDGNGLIHSTGGNSTSEVYLYSNDKVKGLDGLTTMVGTSFHVLRNSTEAYYDYSETLPDIVDNAFTKEYLSKEVIELNQSNFLEKFYGATTGYFKLTQDINMKLIDVDKSGAVDESDVWNPTETFKGVLSGDGKFSINNLTTAASNGLVKGNNGTFRDLDIYVSSLTQGSGVLGQVASGAHIENVNVYIEKSASHNTGLIMAIQDTVGNTMLKNVHIYDASNNATGFIAGQQINADKTVVVSNVYLYGDNKAINGSTTGKLVGVSGADAVQGTDYYLFNTDIATAISTHAPDFIKNLYNQANA